MKKNDIRIAMLNITGTNISGGYKKYLQEIIPRLLASAEVGSLLCVIPKGVFSTGWKPQDSKFELFEYENVSCPLIELKNYLKKEVDRFSPDVIFIPTERYFKYNNIPIVNMIQNMEPLKYNDIGNPSIEVLKNLFRRHICKRAVRNSDRVIAISNFVREFLINELKVSQDSVGLVYLGSKDISENEELRPDIPSSLLEQPFLFTSGTIRPARGLEDIINAIDVLKEEDYSHFGLIIAGEVIPLMRNYKKKLQKLINPTAISRVWWGGKLVENEMMWCYKNCSLFIMTSRVEACPNIAIEAMGAGCLCISTLNPPMPEIFGDAAFYYNSGNGQELAELITKTLRLGDEEKAVMKEKARKRALQFSWDVTAKKTLNELKKAVENAKRKQYGLS